MIVLERLEKANAIVICILLLELVFFKFIPDIGTAHYQQGTSDLTSFDVFRQTFMTPGSVHHSRFLGNLVLWDIAKIIDEWTSMADIRLHPLRLAAAVMTPIYFVIGVMPGLVMPNINWRVFVVYYGVMFLGGMYIFKPYDAPSLACVSVSLYFLLRDKYKSALFMLLLAGLFRESAFHIVAFAFIWLSLNKKLSLIARATLIFIFMVSFILEYILIRYYYPGPVSASEVIDWHEVFFGPGMLSLTGVVTLSLLATFPISYLIRSIIFNRQDSYRNSQVLPEYCGRLRKFFLVNCLIVPLWVLFYRIMGGGVAEFRIFWPVIIPCVYGIASTFDAR